MAKNPKTASSHNGSLFQAGSMDDTGTVPDTSFLAMNVMRSDDGSPTPATGSSESFSQLYLLSVNPTTGATTVSFGEAPNETVSLASGSVLYGGEHFTVNGAPHEDGTYSYVGEAKVNGQVIGFTAFNQYGQEILFSNDSSLNFGSSVTVLNGIDTTICFTAGTKIATPTGALAVDVIKIGDLVCTFESQPRPVKWVGIQTVSRSPADPSRVNPIRIMSSALGDNLPVRDLRVSPDHALLVGGTLVHASALVNGTTIVQETGTPTNLVYYHVELEDHSLILAEGVPAETFINNVDRLGFDNWAEHEALYPNSSSIEEMDRPRAKSHRQVPYSVRKLIAERACIILGGTKQAA